MTHSLDLKIRSLNEFGVGEGKEYHALVCIQDLLDANGDTESILTWKIPLEANVRRPTRNLITESIVKSLREGIHAISSPIHIAADCQKINTNFIRLTFRDRNGFCDGLIDGGHRLLSFCIASQQKIDLSKIFVNIIIYSNYDGRQLKDKAVALNTTKAVSKMSLVNYGGGFDWMKHELKNYDIIYHEGQHGSSSTYTDGPCKINRIHQILVTLDTSYSPGLLEKKKRHPKVAVYSDRACQPDFAKKIQYLFPLVHDAIDTQSKIFQELDRRHQLSPAGTQFTTSTKDTRRFTRLPDRVRLSCVIKHQTLILPIISAFRVYVVDENGVPKLQISSNKKTRLIKKMVSKYFSIATQKKYAGQTVSAITLDDYTWDKMYEICVDSRKNEQIDDSDDSDGQDFTMFA